MIGRPFGDGSVSIRRRLGSGAQAAGMGPRSVTALVGGTLEKPDMRPENGGVTSALKAGPGHSSAHVVSREKDETVMKPTIFSPLPSHPRRHFRRAGGGGGQAGSSTHTAAIPAASAERLPESGEEDEK